MKFIEQFTEFASFAIAEARIPIKEVESYLATRLQLDSIKKILLDQKGSGPSLIALREPDLSKVNYLIKVRGGVEAIWKQIISNLRDIPAPRLLESLDRGWIKAQQQIDDRAQKETRKVFYERAVKKIEIIKEEAKKIGAEKGIPAILKWLGSLKESGDFVREKTAKEQSKYGEERNKQKRELDELKKRWVQMLGKSQGETLYLVRRFLLLTVIALLAGFFFWFFNISISSLLGTIGVLIFILISLWISKPLIRQLLLSRKFSSLSHKLSSGYRILSFSSLDELAKKIESEYWEELKSQIESVEKLYHQRMINIKKREEDLEKNLIELQSSLTKNDPTIRRLFTDEDLENWYKKGYSNALAVLPQREEKMADLNEETEWDRFESQSQECFSFLEEISAENQLYLHYPDKDERMKFLQSLREAVLGNTEKEAFISLDLSSIAGSLEVNLLIGIYNYQNSKLAEELHNAWGHSGVGLSITESDAHVITMCSLVSGIRFPALKEAPDCESSFERIDIKKRKSIFPVLFPEDMEEKE